MALDSAIFLIFLAGIAVVHAYLPAQRRYLALLAASLAFYACSSVNYLVLMGLLSGLNYGAAQALGQASSNSRSRPLVFGGIVVINLAVLIAMKYLADKVGPILFWCGYSGASVEPLRLAIPLGLSYVTFQMLAYVTDVYRQSCIPANSFGQFLLFSLFFPQVSSGPIPRAEQLLPQLATGTEATAAHRLAGVRMMAYGYFKKYVVANRLSEYVSTVFPESGHLESWRVFLACCFNVLQLYADFSGYVDIAIGSALVLGIQLPANFDRPFTSTSVTELWRRWHMTLSFWLRDYLYMPLFVRIRALGRLAAVLALMITFGICGLWHAATWNYLLFGLSQSAAMSAEFLTKSWRTKQLKPIPKYWVMKAGNFYVLGFFTLTEVLFGSSNLAEAGNIYGRLFHWRLLNTHPSTPWLKPYYLALDFIAVACWVGISRMYRKSLDRTTPWFLLVCALLILWLGRLGSAHFIYAAF